MTTAPYDPDGLWIKARMFSNRAMDANREFEERAFWASAALELLGKAALSRHSPLLIANPNDDGKSFLIASGLQGDTSDFMSVQAKTIWSRCQRAFKPFSETEAKKIYLGRSEYLHSASVGFDAIPESAWWPRYWEQASILVGHLDQEITDLVGPVRATVVESYLRENKENLRKRLEALIEKARARLAQSQTDTMSPRLLKEWNSYRIPGYAHVTSAECPACGKRGWLMGEDVDETRVDYSGDPDSYDVDVWLTVPADEFACDVCHLSLASDLLTIAGLETSFEVEGSADDLHYEDEYNNE